MSNTRAAHLPQHVAIVMDGNGRWAKRRFLPRLAGHKRGVDSLRAVVRHCIDRDIPVLSVFAFSSENWNRPAEEVSGLMGLLAKALSGEVLALKEAGVRLVFPGDRAALSAGVQAGLAQAESDTASNRKLILNICFNYGGRWDIVQAARALAASGTPITDESLSERLALHHVPNPDLLIRTGGEVRLSNFMLWQTAYSELYFSDKLWPEFGAQELDAALEWYARRERRFGKTSEQVAVASAVASD